MPWPHTSAHDLLMSMLSPAQQEQLLKDGKVSITGGSTGRIYTVIPTRWTFNVVFTDELDGTESMCFEPSTDDLDGAMITLLQLLALRVNENEVLRVANI